MAIQIDIPEEDIRVFCERWSIVEFALFGSVLRDDFCPDSDLDVLVTFAPDFRKTLFDLVRMRDELKVLLGRNIDLVQSDCLDNPFRRRAILESKETIYAA